MRTMVLLGTSHSLYWKQGSRIQWEFCECYQFKPSGMMHGGWICLWDTATAFYQLGGYNRILKGQNESCYTVLILKLSLQFSGNLLLLKFASVAMMKHWPISSWRGKSLLNFQVIVSLSLRRSGLGIQDRNIEVRTKQKPWLLTFSSTFLTESGPTCLRIAVLHRGLDPLTSIINWENAPQTFPLLTLMKEFLSWVSPLYLCSSVYEVDKTN